jgi:hypothetical protein
VKLDEFITNVLVDIHKGLDAAEKQTDRDYHIQGSNNEGVTFDIAVTTVNTQGSRTEGKAEGKANVGFIEVLGVHISSDIGAKVEDKIENSEISRIQFTVYVPAQTNTEYAQNRRQAQERQQQLARDLDPYPH